MMYGTYHRFAEYYDVDGMMNHSWLDQNNELHNGNGPALVRFMGNSDAEWIYQKIWYQHGKKHRENNPAVIHYSRTGKILAEGWYSSGLCHKIDGPAVKRYLTTGAIIDEAWYLNDREYISFGEWFKDTPLPLHEKVEMKLTWG